MDDTCAAHGKGVQAAGRKMNRNHRGRGHGLSEKLDNNVDEPKNLKSKIKFQNILYFVLCQRPHLAVGAPVVKRHRRQVVEHLLEVGNDIG